MTDSASRKKLSSKVTVSSPIGGMQNSFKNTFPVDGKKAFMAGVSKKSISTTRNEVFVEKYVPTEKLLLPLKNRVKWFPLAAKYFSFKTGSP